MRTEFVNFSAIRVLAIYSVGGSEIALKTVPFIADTLLHLMNEALCDMIREAFAGVKLGTGVGLQQAQGLDNCEDADTCARYRESDERDDWTRIPVEELNRCNSSLSFFDAEGMRFHLPAFLIADLQGTYNFGMGYCLAEVPAYDKSRFTLLSDAQRGAVRAFLRHIVEHPDYAFERPHIIRALNEYWTLRASI